MAAATTLSTKALAQLSRVGRGLVDVVLPPRCLGCGRMVEDPDALCGPCWTGLTFFAPPWCASCGLPFVASDGRGRGMRRLRARAAGMGPGAGGDAL
jgi:Double zinc ribbon domain